MPKKIESQLGCGGVCFFILKVKSTALEETLLCRPIFLARKHWDVVVLERGMGRWKDRAVIASARAKDFFGNLLPNSTFVSAMVDLWSKKAPK
jgi:hypothetical protein